MYRNSYDTDCITWSPQGRIFQVEYAMEAVKQGTCCVALRSDTDAVLVSLRRSVSKLASYHQKILAIDEHVGIAMSGITADARRISKFMRNECLFHQYTYNAPLPVSRLVSMVADKMQIATQQYSNRPYGVGLLVVGVDSLGPHVFEICPSGNHLEYFGIAIGSRSQSSKTFLEKLFKDSSKVAAMDRTELVLVGLKAIKASLSQDIDLTTENICIGFVGKDQHWTELDDVQIQELIDHMTESEASVPMDVDADVDAEASNTQNS